jgi:hypothetical protein
LSDKPGTFIIFIVTTIIIINLITIIGLSLHDCCVR